MSTAKGFIGLVVVALPAALFCPTAQAVPVGKWCFPTPVGKVCIPLDNIDLNDFASAEDECGVYPPGPRCGDATIPPYGSALTQLPTGEWSLKLPNGTSVSPVTTIQEGTSTKTAPTPSNSWDGRGLGVR
jgi:hypothetical protein